MNRAGVAEWRHLVRSAGPAIVLAAAAIFRIASDAHPATGGFHLWLPWLEQQAWPPLQRIVTAVLLASGAVITFRVAGRQSLSRVAFAVTLVAIWLFPIGASTAGFALCALFLWACDRYIQGPALSGAEGFLALLTVGISAIQLDYGVYVALAAIAAFVARHRRAGRGAIGRAALGFAGTGVVLMLLLVPLGEVGGSMFGLGSRVTQVVAHGSPVGEATFNVRWAAGTTDPTRIEKEREHALVDGRQVEEDASGRTWRYRWNRLSSASVLRLLNDAAVEDTQGIDRTSSRYVGTSGSPGVNLAWLEALPYGRTSVVLKAVALAPWLWVVLPLAGAIRVGRRSIGRISAHREPLAELTALPALVLCVPVVRLVLQDSSDTASIAAPAFAAMAVVTAWLISAPFPRQLPDAAIGGAYATTRPRVMTREHASHLYICAGLAALTVFLHLSVNTDITNDHVAYLSMARQIVLGNWPIRDFRDDGALLQILLSAAVQKVGGYRLLGEMLLSWTFFAVSSCLTYWLAFRLSGKRLAAAIAAALGAILLPRPYGYPKLFIYPFAILVLWRYVERPRPGRLAAIGATIALAFLFRVDHGVVIAVTSVVTVAAVHGHELRAAARACLRLAAVCLLFLTPHLAYVVWSAGLSRYVESVLTFGVFGLTNREPWPLSLSVQQGLLSETNAVTFLLNFSVVIACVALIAAAVQIRRAWMRNTPATRDSLWVLVVVVMWGLMIPMLARGGYYTRSAEIGEPIAILGAWLAVKWLSANPESVKRWTLLCAALTMTVVALCSRMPIRSFFQSADVYAGMPFQAHTLKDLATSPPIDVFAPRGSTGEFQQLVRWARECTTGDDRLMVTSFAPELYFYTGRAFAGDRWAYGTFDNSPRRQQQVVEQVKSQSVPIVFINADARSPVQRASWPALFAYLNESYRLVATVPIPNDHALGVLVSNSRIPSRYAPFRNLPCFN